MLTYYFLEVILNDRLHEQHKELMTRAALREAFGEKGNRFPLFPKLQCRLSGFLAGVWSWDFLLIQPIELPFNINPCMG